MQKNHSENDGAQIVAMPSDNDGGDWDPEGWMAEQDDYWAKQSAARDGRVGGLRGAAREIASLFKRIGMWLNPRAAAQRRALVEAATQMDEEDWTLLSESALGPLRPANPAAMNDAQTITVNLEALPSPWMAGKLTQASTDQLAMANGAANEALGQGLISEDAIKPTAKQVRSARKRHPKC